MQYNNTYDSTDRLTASTITDSGLMYNKANRDYASQKIYERLDDDSKISVKDISTEIFAHKFIDDVTKPMQPIEKYLPESLRFNTSARNADIGGYDKRMPVFIFIEKVFEYELRIVK